ncbi:MAG: glycosyltransferase family 4 protein [Vicinamibacterales bacterium]
MTPPRVLMLTGAYFPETSGASLQCRQLVRTLSDRASFTVLTTTTDRALASRDVVDGVEVRRIFVDPASAVSKATAAVRMAAALLRLSRRFDIVHLHGFSQKSMLVIAAAELLGKRIVIKLTSIGHDDPQAMRERGAIAYWFYRAADRFIGVSPQFERSYRAAGLPSSRYRFIPNGVELDRFRPASDAERAALRHRLGLPSDLPVVLFVGFFSREKRPDVLFASWVALFDSGVRSTLVLVGATRSSYYEIDSGMAARVRDESRRRGFADRVVLVESTGEIESYFRAADIFALPTTREGLPNVLLESMASGVPPVISRLEGVTDWIVEDGKSGRLVPVDDPAALTAALRDLITSPEHRQQLGLAARVRVEARFASTRTAEDTLAVYAELARDRGGLAA